MHLHHSVLPTSQPSSARAKSEETTRGVTHSSMCMNQNRLNAACPLASLRRIQLAELAAVAARDALPQHCSL